MHRVWQPLSTQMYTQVAVWQLCQKIMREVRVSNCNQKGNRMASVLYFLEKIITHLALPVLMKLEGQKPESVEHSPKMSRGKFQNSKQGPPRSKTQGCNQGLKYVTQ